MERIISLCLVLLLLVSGCDTPGKVDPVFRKTFIKYYGTEGDQYGADLLVNEDGSILILGNSVSLSGVRTPFVIKADLEGNVIWEKSVGAVNHVAVDIEPIKGSAGDFVVAMNDETGGTTSITLVKGRQDGTFDPLVEIDPSGTQRQMIRTITSLESGQFVIAGLADRTLIEETAPINESNDQSDILAFLLDQNMAVIDTVVTKGGEMNGCAVRIFELDGVNDGKLVMFSYTDRPHLTDAFGYNFSFDILHSGVPVGKLIGEENDQEYLAAAIKVPFLNGGGYLMAGTSRPSVDAPGELYLVKYDDEFQQKALDVRLSLGRNLECVSAENASSGYYLLANERNTGSMRDITLVRVRSDGEGEWTTSFGTREGDDTSAAISALPDGRIAVLGTMELQTKRKVALIVLKSDGNF